MTASSTPELEADRQALIALIGAEAVFHGDFTLSSGKKASYYVDMRKLTLDHRAAPAIGRIMLDLVRTGLGTDADTVVAGEVIVMDLVFEDSGTTLAVASTHIACVIWE